MLRSPSSVSELVDQHKQLRHEAGGLKLQLAAKQEILDRVVDLLDASIEELASAKRTIESQAATIEALTQQSLAAGKTRNTCDIAVDTSDRQNSTGIKKQTNLRQPQRQPPPSTSEITNNTASISGFEKLTVDLNGLEDFITGGTNIIIDENGTSTTSTAAHSTRQPIVTPVSARDLITAFEKASREAMLLQQSNLIGNKSPELASQCKITAAARAGNDADGGGNGKKKKENEGKTTQAEWGATH